MSVMGQEQTYAPQQVMSALLPRADMCSARGHVCYGPEADMPLPTTSQLRCRARASAGLGAWFRVGLISTYERGIMVGLSWEGLVEESEGLRAGDYATEKERMNNFILTGFIPYENIETIDWDGDQYYSYPTEHENM